ncbi:hypothetical protein T484DRAFT_1855699 [Baffinella frigidus]|nr:hypothetical protein T484DRAFT_1855699 [Cryptophyta sp. CCMP2293]
MLAFPPVHQRTAMVTITPFQQDPASFVNLKGPAQFGRRKAPGVPVFLKDPFMRLLADKALDDLDDSLLPRPLAFRREAALRPLPTEPSPEPEQRPESPLRPGDELSRRIARRLSIAAADATSASDEGSDLNDAAARAPLSAQAVAGGARSLPPFGDEGDTNHRFQLSQTTFLGAAPLGAPSELLPPRTAVLGPKTSISISRRHLKRPPSRQSASPIERTQSLKSSPVTSPLLHLQRRSAISGAASVAPLLPRPAPHHHRYADAALEVKGIVARGLSRSSRSSRTFSLEEAPPFTFIVICA